MDTPNLARFAWLSIAAAVVTMALKLTAYLLTDSVGLLSDALESGVNLAAGVLATYSLSVVAQPPDDDHAFGHEKAEYFSSGAEGALVLLAAIAIAWAAFQRLLNPQPLTGLDFGLAISIAASLVNLFVARYLLRAAQRTHSIALEASSRHLQTDVWTSAAVLAGVGLVWLTGWIVLDPLVALAAAVHVGWTGISLVQRSVRGLMDTALPAEQLAQIESVLADYQAQGVHYHTLRTRQAGLRTFVSVHIQVPGDWSVQAGHDLMEEVEARIRRQQRNATVLTHIEPIEDPASWRDEHLGPSKTLPSDEGAD